MTNFSYLQRQITDCVWDFSHTIIAIDGPAALYLLHNNGPAAHYLLQKNRMHFGFIATVLLRKTNINSCYGAYGPSAKGQGPFGPGKA